MGVGEGVQLLASHMPEGAPSRKLEHVLPTLVCWLQTVKPASIVSVVAADDLDSEQIESDYALS